MNQGEKINWSGLGSGSSIQKLNGNLGDAAKKSDHSDQVPNLTFSLPKRLDDSQEVPNSELPNGHTSAENEGIPKPKGILDDTEELPDTVLVDSATDNPDDKEDLTREGTSEKKSDPKGDSSPRDAEKKPSKAEDSQDMFETSNEGTKTTNNADAKDADTSKDFDESQNMKLEVTESQFIKDVDSSQDSSKEPENDDKGDVDTKDEDEADVKPSSPGQSAAEVSSTEPSEQPAVQSDNAESGRSTPSTSEPCSCEPSCHARVRSVSNRLSSACKQLGDFIKLKRRVENPELANLLSVLTTIESIAENKPHSMASPLPDQAFYALEPGSSKKKSRARYDHSTPIKEPVEKKPRKVETPKPAPPKKVDFQTIKGLAVFAKWPNSGWYYPGVVEGLSAGDWKESTNVTVTFYDGLVREMKNINILPANLIPPGVILCDLEDETEMNTSSTNVIEDNKVEFKLSLKEDPNTLVDVGFHKLAIRAAHMKSIKQHLEPTADVSAKKMHMVSLDNLVSGRRSRVRTTKEDSDEVVETPRKGTRKSVRKAAEDVAPPTEEAMEDDEAPKATPSRKRSASIDQSSTPKRQTKRVK